MSEASDDDQDPSRSCSSTNAKPSIPSGSDTRNRSGDQGKSMLPPPHPFDGRVARRSYNYLGSYTREDPNVPRPSNLGTGDFLSDSDIDQNQAIEAAKDFVFTQSKPTGPNQHSTPQSTYTASFNYQGRSNIVETLSYIQSTGIKTRSCDRCYGNQWYCDAWRMPCPRCRADQAQCTDDRPRREYNVVPRAFPPGSDVGYNQNQAIEAGNTLASTRSTTTTESNQYETPPNTLAVNHQHQSNTIGPPHALDLNSVQGRRPLHRNCDRCFRNGWNCSKAKLPCSRCKNDQVHCTNDRPMFQSRDQAQACFMQDLADADCRVGTNSTRVD
jgi:hypothetical protein